MNYKHLHYFWMVARNGGIVRAAKALHITPQTLSGQMTLLESSLGHALFQKQGRGLVLTERGRLVFSYAEDIFSLGAELESVMRSEAPQGRALEFRVGVADSVSKTMAYRLLAPALAIPEPVRLVCRESRLPALLADLALHRLDLVLADAPVPSASGVKAFSYRLGTSGLSFFAAPHLIQPDSLPFPACLNDLPMLCVGEDAGVHSALLSWLAQENLHPHMVGEFDDGALMKAFGREGFGVFVAPSVLEEEVCAQYGVAVLGRTQQLQETFYAISMERRISHACVVAIQQFAQTRLFKSAKTSS